ncbi:MAG: hypothetical protein US94_C0013G0004 [Berkelbacteria bacterium GW2011_GWB1_38_5]|uniref:Uncharacterized protein n=1 Tax=Berkelbacteria bacterium GW2011_GWB1_38_5 TaxID=1618336 RepID=A0A0G0MKB5_9BACT|nr:MAG: hypothetical protein US94_C0013G0004 [Berkelbacteria bacterium GW2011_GWB1_38_5]
MAKKETPLTKETAKTIIQEVIEGAFKELFPIAFNKAFEPYAVAIQADFHKIGEKVAEIPTIKKDIGDIKEDLSDVKDTVNRIELIQKSEIKRVDEHSVKLKKLEHKLA